MANKKILVVDDEKELVETISMRLKANNYDVVTACNGQEGLKVVKEQNPHLIILDVCMSEMDGFSFVQELKSNEGFGPMPIIMLTAKESMQDLFKAEGIENYLVKPYEPEELLKRIKEMIGE